MGDSWEVFQAVCERGRSTSERLVVICGASRQLLKPLLVRPATERGRGITGYQFKVFFFLPAFSPMFRISSFVNSPHTQGSLSCFLTYRLTNFTLTNLEKVSYGGAFSITSHCPKSKERQGTKPSPLSYSMGKERSDKSMLCHIQPYRDRGSDCRFNKRDSFIRGRNERRGVLGDKLSYFTYLFHPLLARIIT